LANHSLYTFHPLADEQQTDIWLYTHQHWGPQQADQYIDGLHEKLIKIAEDFSLVKNLPSEINPQIKFFHYGRHYIFLRKVEAGHYQEKFQVLTLLHDNMDIPSKLRGLLQELSQ
jgi:toxin ParE1/3/4